ncbi:MAG: sigma-54-dependent Fis family transcriptional regulator [Verrucomicrobia subdivision 3 bacterium]|nr:sigma-54-dependent Fis family transcriptional regulator [Limisphaerales bacterium]
MSELDLSGVDILLLEDDPMLRKREAALLERLGADVNAVDNLEGARRLIATLPFDFAVLDVNLPDGLGTDLLKENIFAPDTAIIVVTAHGGVAGAVEAMRLGASDYLVKPFETEELPLVLERARRSRQTARVEEHRRSDRAKAGFFFGNALKPLEAQLEKILTADRRMNGLLPPVLIQGETGTGKTALARWLHEHGPRATGELVEVNCSALPEALAESELFGHERGAFTDARTTRMGLFEAAQGGTLFLDELPSLSPALQAKVLTVIEDHRIRRVGGNKPIPVDARIIAATQYELKERVAQGLFREDLFHRLDLYRVAIPPLRDRGDDIVKLAEWFLCQLAHKHRLTARQLSATGRARLLTHHWPGNVRELAHELERALVFEEGEELNFAQLPGSLAAIPTGQPEWLKPGFTLPDSGFSLEESINRFMQLALAQTDGNVSAAARLLGVPRDFVRYRLGLKTKPPDGN